MKLPLFFIFAKITSLYMKQFFVCVLFSLGLISCSKPEDVEKRVNEMYSNVVSAYLKQNFSVDFDSLYFSEEFYCLDSQIGDIENQLGEPIIHDFDDWICAQDFGKDLSAKVNSVKMRGNKKALVNVIIHNCGQDSEQNLTVVYERGNWFIDDMFDGTRRQQIIDELKRLKQEGIEPRI